MKNALTNNGVSWETTLLPPPKCEKITPYKPWGIFEAIAFTCFRMYDFKCRFGDLRRDFSCVIKWRGFFLLSTLAGERSVSAPSSPESSICRFSSDGTVLLFADARRERGFLPLLAPFSWLAGLCWWTIKWDTKPNVLSMMKSPHVGILENEGRRI